ncbi:hypothetical protein LCGC14_1171590 [marine sediment metagenome]|uniref:Uncharacterized protein n=1 Tax=marine sediment metagenome TaxID=412755 RepID=A0A0F9P7V0_9ZZZZ
MDLNKWHNPYKTVLPNGCWFLYWTSAHLIGFWAQHGANREARRFFPGNVPSGDIVQWVLACHKRAPCEMPNC